MLAVLANELPSLEKNPFLYYFRQCSECDSSESDDSDANDGVDTNAPRKLRESHQIKLPAKFTLPPKESKKVHVHVLSWC